MAKSPRKQPLKNQVTLISDPFGINTADIAEEQDRTEELSLDEPVEDSPSDQEIEQLESAIKSAIDDIQEKQIQELEALTPDQAQESAERLANEIAEDLALAAELNGETAPSVDDESSEAALFNSSLLTPAIEALLLMSPEPIKIERLKQILSTEDEDGKIVSGPKASEIKEALAALSLRYQKPEFGFELKEIAGGYQFRTKAEMANITRKLAKTQTYRLSTGAMESLAIVAYQQPILKEAVDAIRGVDSSHFLRILMERGLIEISGRSDMPGRPMIYNTTSRFLEIFGLGSLADLPPMSEIEQMIPKSETEGAESDDPRVRQMRKLVNEMTADHSTSLLYDPREDEVILKNFRETIQGIKTTTDTLEAEAAENKQETMDKKEAAISGQLTLTPETVGINEPQTTEPAPATESAASTDLIADSTTAEVIAVADL